MQASPSKHFFVHVHDGSPSQTKEKNSVMDHGTMIRFLLKQPNGHALVASYVQGVLKDEENAGHND